MLTYIENCMTTWKVIGFSTVPNKRQSHAKSPGYCNGSSNTESFREEWMAAQTGSWLLPGCSANLPRPQTCARGPSVAVLCEDSHSPNSIPSSPTLSKCNALKLWWTFVSSKGQTAAHKVQMIKHLTRACPGPETFYRNAKYRIITTSFRYLHNRKDLWEDNTGFC